jgi:hypothetical protein
MESHDGEQRTRRSLILTRGRNVAMRNGFYGGL